MVEVSVLSRKILRELCTNSRITITELAEKYNVSRHLVKERIEAIEREFQIRYTIEPNYAALGIPALHVLKIKFTKQPKPDDLESHLQKSRIAQFVALTKGDFSAVIFTASKSTIEYARWETAFALEFAKYGVAIRSSEINIMHLGFVPVNTELLQASKIDDIYKKMLIVLNENSRISIRDLSKKLGISEALTRYYFRELGKTDYVKRFTAIVTKSPLPVNLVYFANYTIQSGIEKRVDRERRAMYWKETDEFPIVSEFPAAWSTSGSWRFFCWVVCQDEKSGIKSGLQPHLDTMKEDTPKFRKAVITKVIKGFTPVRNIDQKENYLTVDWGNEVL